MRERETKLAPAPGFRLPDLTGVAEGVSTAPADTLDLLATYFDTADLRLARSGASLRYRNDEGWVVKLPKSDGADDGLLSRNEHHFDGAPGAPPADALDLVLGLIRTAPVAPVTRMRTRRQRLELRGPDDKPVAEVVDDEVSILDRGHVAARFRELEVELRDDTDPDLARAVVDRLREAGAGEPDPTPKVVRALGPRALDAPDVLPTPDLGDAANTGDVLRAALAPSVSRLIAHDAGVRLGEDPEAVHQARVATRRLRSDLRTFHALLDEEWNESLRDELKWIATGLGAVRDADVLLARLRERVNQLLESDRDAAGALVARLGDEREHARAALLEDMRSSRYLELLDRLVDAARAPVLTPEAGQPAADVLPGLVRKPLDRIDQAVAELDDDPPDEALHDIRKRAKRVRYAAEAAAPVIGKPARRLASAMEDVQDVLGEHQDAVVAEQWLRDALVAASPRQTFVIGQLAALERAEANARRAAWSDAWKAASRKRLRSWI
ncbi:MAG: CYTH and CHAD domain-containing protein [Actinobacteria bacterium]|nr:CYTH and CHAD domain-containing protein [Actinomycetota bacterium]